MTDIKKEDKTINIFCLKIIQTSQNYFYFEDGTTLSILDFAKLYNLEVDRRRKTTGVDITIHDDNK